MKIFGYQIEFIDNWRTVLWASHSAKTAYVAVLLLLGNELFYAVTGRSMMPWTLFVLVFGLNMLMPLLRIVKQPDEKMGRTKVRSPALVAAMAVALSMSMIGNWSPSNLGSQAYPAPHTEAYQELFDPIAIPKAKKWEGLRTVPYLDRIARPPVWTVCYGETLGIGPGDTFTEAECDAMLGRRLWQFHSELLACYAPETKETRLPPTRGAAYATFAYNIGSSGACRSTAIRQLNAGNIARGCRAMGMWNKAGGRVILGLQNRRADETALCLRGLDTVPVA